MNRNGLDEMQTERRNRIGNQMFMLMFYALWLNGLLYSYGVRWLDYPGNVMVITVVCMAIYLVRLVVSNAYLPAKTRAGRATYTLIMGIVFSIALVLAAINLFGPAPAEASWISEGNTALVLFIASAVGLVAVLITAAIRKVNSRHDTDE